MSTIFCWKLLILILKSHHNMRIVIISLSIDLVWQIFLLDLIISLLSVVLLNHLLTSLYLWCTWWFILLDSTNVLSWCNDSLFRIRWTYIIVLMSFLRSYPIHVTLSLSTHSCLIILDRSVEWNLNPSIIVSYNG